MSEDQKRETCPHNGDEVRHMFVIGQPRCLCGEKEDPNLWRLTGEVGFIDHWFPPDPRA